MAVSQQDLNSISNRINLDTKRNASTHYHVNRHLGEAVDFLIKDGRSPSAINLDPIDSILAKTSQAQQAGDDGGFQLRDDDCIWVLILRF